MVEIHVCRNDDNQKRYARDKIDLSGIVTVVADFPAHCSKILPAEALNQCCCHAVVPGTAAMRVPLESSAAG
jgi:hypothetical protein